MYDELLPRSTARSAIGDGKTKCGRMPSVDRVATAHGGPHAVATLASRQLRLDEEQRALQIRKIAGVQNLDPGIVLPVEGVVSAGQPAFFASSDELNQRPR